MIMARIEQHASDLVRDTPQYVKDKIAQNVYNSDLAYFHSAELSLEYRRTTGKPKSACNLAAGLLYGVAESTIRDRVRVFLAVPVDMREEISMPASYWREACTGTGGDEFKLIENVTQIMEHRDAYGQLPSIDTVRGWNSKHNGILVWRSRLESLLTTIEKLIHDPLAPSKIVGFLRGVATYLQGENK